MNSQSHGRRTIIDASFLRGTRADGYQLQTLADRGDQIIIIDNLAYELCSTCSRDQWAPAQRKLAAFADVVVCWHHTGTMLRIEGEQNRPFGDPTFPEATRTFRELLQGRTTYTPDDLEATIAAARRQRETAPLPAMFRAFAACAANATRLAEAISNKPIASEELAVACQSFVNNPDALRRLMSTGPDRPQRDLVDESWVTWHHYKAFLAVFCDYLRRGCPVFEELPDNARGRWINIKHDLDYLIALAFADAIASGETSGEQFHYRRWIYGDQKTFISLGDVWCLRNAV